jgi:hypothetical protein
MVTPAIWTLNFRDIGWLTDELIRWKKVANRDLSRSFTLSDKQDVFVYLDAVEAERNQRLEQGKTIVGTILGGFSAPFEGVFGGSGGKGAAGLPSATVDAAKSVADVAGGVADTAKAAGKNILIAVTILGIAYLYFTQGKRK